MNSAPSHHKLFFALCVLATPCIAAAQEEKPLIDPASIEACSLMEVDSQRLICYDTAVSRTTSSTQQADAAAKQAKAIVKEKKKNPDTHLGRAGAVFAIDDYDALRANAGKGSLLDSRWELASDSKLGTFQIRGYKPVYILPAFWTSKLNITPTSPNPETTVTAPQNLKNIEAKFQLSFKTKIVENIFGDNGDIWAAYTQSSRWQVYNAETSRPFRETNYEPEVILAFRNNYSLGGWHGRLLGASITHQSNGRSDPLSRSWNRVIGIVGLDRENWSVMIRPWYRIPDGKNDDNPDIEDYIGRADVTLIHSNNGYEFSMTGRHSLRTGDNSHGSLQASWAFPIQRNLRGHIEVFHGYGESLIDYNHKATYLGLGISLLEWY